MAVKIPKEQIIDRVLRHFSRQTTFSVLLRSYLSILVIGAIDYATGPFLPMLVFYLIPIIVVTWFIGRNAGLFISIVSSMGCLLKEILFYPIFPNDSMLSFLLLLWDPLTSISIFLIVVLALSAMRKAKDEELLFEFKVAAEVQSRLLPQSFPALKTLSYSAICKSTNDVSGDYYDFLTIEPNKLGIAIGDIAGKGISAALLMANLQGLLRSYAPLHSDDIVKLMSAINNSLYACTESNKFATLFYGLYDDINQTLTYVNAGHNPPLIFHKDNNLSVSKLVAADVLPVSLNHEKRNNEVIRLDRGGAVIGAFLDVVYESNRIQLSLGDTIVFFTDGLLEARNFAHEQYGEDRLLRIVSDNLHCSSNNLHDIIMQDVNKFSGGGNQFDDITLIVAKVN